MARLALGRGERWEEVAVWKQKTREGCLGISYWGWNWGWIDWWQNETDRICSCIAV